MKTTLLVTIIHAKPLPSKMALTDEVAGRVYGVIALAGQNAEVGCELQLIDVAEKAE